MASFDGLRGIVRTLQHPNYGLYASGNAISLIGTWMQRIAVGWVAWELTGSGFWLGMVAFADLFPSVFVGPIAGAIADRTSQLRIIIISQSLAMLQATALAVLTATGVMTIGLLAGLVLFQGIVIGFNQPSRLALIPALVPRADLATAVAINSILFNLARFIGPAIAGVLILTVGPAVAFAVNALSFLAFLLALSRIRVQEQVIARAGPKGSLLHQIGDGVRYSAEHPGIGPMLVLHMTTALCVRPFVELLPGFATDVFNRGADALALLSSTIGIGAIVAGFWLAQRDGKRALTPIALLSSAVIATAILGFVATDRLAVALVAVAVAGFGMIATGVASQTLIQMAVAPGMRGRVLSLYGIIFRGGPAVGSLLIGAASEWLGLRWPLALGALLSLVAWAWAWRRRHAMGAALEGAQDGHQAAGD